ncbi:hypothetical protein EB43_00368 [Enterococcus faecium]|nr:hypothetical protein EB43_00368 [Enterococcus faecium]
MVLIKSMNYSGFIGIFKSYTKNKITKKLTLN